MHVFVLSIGVVNSQSMLMWRVVVFLFGFRPRAAVGSVFVCFASDNTQIWLRPVV